jgi:ATP-dependent Lon protease
MNSSRGNYNLRSKNSESQNLQNEDVNGKKRSRIYYDGVKFTKDGYIDDGFIVEDDDDWIPGEPEPNVSDYFSVDSQPIQDDIVNKIIEGQDIDPKIARTAVSNAFKGTGSHLIEKYTGCKASDESWKIGQSSSIINTVEPQLKKIRKMIEDEIPTIPKIYKANITEMDKMKCTKLYDQLQNIEPFTAEYDSKVAEINNILRKGNRYTKGEIRKLEEEAKNLKSLATPPDDLEDRILKLDADKSIKAIIYGQYLEMLAYEVGSQTYNSIREEIEWSVRLPHNKSHETTDLSNLSPSDLNNYYQHFLKLMDEELYGMRNIKLKMLHIINDRRKSGNGCARNIAIVGPPGTGKTAIGSAMAKVLGLPFEKISMGGMDDASIFKGSDRVWNSSSPSIVLQILSRIKSSSGVIMFDEIDKLGETPKGREVQYTLLHISDYIHNKEFRDNYLNKYPHDFSKLLFVFCANKIETLDSALLNRLDIIYTRSYTEEEKLSITTNYVLPRALEKLGIKANQIKFNTKALDKLVSVSTNDPGVRTIEKIIKEVVGKINMYNSVMLDDGTTGSLDLGYTIPNFKLPLIIDVKLLNDLTADMAMEV